MEFYFYTFFFIVIAYSAIIHEYSHGWMADRLGDPTARLSGRLTLNPIAHIDPIWTIVMPVVLLIFSQGALFFAAAKPVPINPYNLRNSRYGVALVSFAGPGSNIITALVLGLLMRFISPGPFLFYLGIIVYANILLAIFNLVPIPPLDGSKILMDFLPDRFNTFKVFLQTYGFFVLLVFILFLFDILVPIILYIFWLFTGYDFSLFLASMSQ